MTLSPLLLGELVEAAESFGFLKLGVSTLAITLVLTAIQGRRALRYGSLLGSWVRIGLVVLAVLGILLGLGVIPTLNLDPLVELVESGLRLAGVIGPASSSTPLSGLLAALTATLSGGLP